MVSIDPQGLMRLATIYTLDLYSLNGKVHLTKDDSEWWTIVFVFIFVIIHSILK